MTELTIEIPDTEEKFNWREFIKKVIELKRFELELEKSNKLKLLLLKSITEKGKLSEKEAEEITENISDKIKLDRINKSNKKEA